MRPKAVLQPLLFAVALASAPLAAQTLDAGETPLAAAAPAPAPPAADTPVIFVDELPPAAEPPRSAAEAPAEGETGTQAEADDAALLLLLLEADDPLFDDDAGLVTETASRDPFEGVNRRVFSFNRGLDIVLLDPVTRTYQFLVPAPGRRAIERAFLNLDTPVIFANQVLQLRPKAAAGTLCRFVINTTAGAGGLFDPAAHGVGLERTEADFGQTLARYGTPSGPYLILPVFGPSTARDAFGDVVDVMSDPLTYLTGPFQWWRLLLGGGEGLVVLESNVDQLRALEAGSIDFYSALRSAYLQNRDAEVREARGEPRQSD